MLLLPWVGHFHLFALPFVSIVFGTLFFALPLLLIRHLYRRHPWLTLFAGPAVFIIFDYIRVKWILPFPFGILGYSQFHWVRLIQFVDLTGVAGVTFLIILVNLIFHYEIDGIFRRRRLFSLQQLGPLVLTAVLFFSLYVYGNIRLKELTPSGTIVAGILQTNYSPRESWADRREENLATIERLAVHRPLPPGSMLILPECAVDSFLTVDPELSLPFSTEILNRMSSIAKTTDSYLLFGTLEMKQGSGRIKRYNSAFLFSPDGNLSGIQRKNALVPFGEFYPFGRFLPALKEDVVSTSGALMLDRGDSLQIQSIRNSDGSEQNFGTLICFESTLPRYSREYMKDGADFLVNITSDRWSESVAGMYQHAIFSVFRALENRSPVLRVSNGGYSGYISAEGRMFSTIPVLQEGVMAVKLTTYTQTGHTIYARYGEWFTLVNLLGLVSVLIYIGWKRIQPRLNRKKTVSLSL